MTFVKPCVDKKFFINRKFKEVSPNVYSRQETSPPIRDLRTGLMHNAERTVTFKIYDVHPDLGTNVEWYIGKRLCASGYWTDQKDFEDTFQRL